jgi:Tfp pilus assembly protein PilF
MLKLNVILSMFVLFFVGYSLAISENTISTFNSIHSDQKQQAIKKGFRLFKAGELDESEEVFKEILRKDKNTLIAKEMLAVI